MDSQTATILVSAALGGLAGAAVSGGLTWWVARGQRDFERNQAREARRQARIEQTYVDVLEHAFRILDYVNRTQPLKHLGADLDRPDFPADPEVRRLNARMAVFGSQAARDKLASLSQGAWEFELADERLRSERRAPRSTGSTELELWDELDAKRSEVRDLHRELIEIANAELEARQIK